MTACGLGDHLMVMEETMVFRHDVPQALSSSAWGTGARDAPR